MALLELSDVCFSYGALTVTDKVSLKLPADEALGVIGPNGAGKTTLVDLIIGIQKPTRGRILFDGRDIGGLSAQARCELGIARSFQVPRPFAGMTVFENLLVGATLGGRRSERAAYPVCFEVLEQTGLSYLANEPAGKLRLLDRKRLELARALATQPKLLLLDEVAGGLSDVECQALIATIRDIHASGIAILWIEHIVHALLAVVTRLFVLDQGAMLADGDPREVIDSAAVKQIYLGVPA